MYNELDLRLPHEESMADARTKFIRSTYAHLAFAILAFIVLETVLLTQVFTSLESVIAVMGGRSAFGPLFVMLAFMGATMLAQMWARSETSVGLQYMGLALCVVAYGVIFVPILYIASTRMPEVIPTAGIMTLAMFGGLTLSVFVTKKDYSALAPVLSIGSMIAFGVIIAGCLFHFNLGLFFSFAMVALMSGYILYETSFVLKYARTDQPVAAAVMLFASIATLFFYILRILMELNRSR